MENLFYNPSHIGMIYARMMDEMNAVRMGAKAGAMAQVSEVYGSQAMEYQVINGTAVIVVRGALMSTMISPYRYYGSVQYEDLVETITQAVERSDVQRVLLRFYSPGGTVTGCAEAAARIDKLSDIKPIWSHCSMADSGAYWLAAATNRIIVEPTGEVGSVGVIMTHFDMSKMMEDFGVKATHLFSGVHKADGTPYQPLSDEARARFEGDMDMLRGQFVDSVAAFRGVDAEVIMKTEAMTYKGKDAVAAGLADDVGFFGDILNAMTGMTGHFNQKQGKENAMGKKNHNESVTEEENPVAQVKGKKDQENEDTDEGDDPAEETDEEDVAEDEEEDEKASAQETERNRISAILTCEEAKGREELAKSLALNSSMSVEEAKKHLNAASSLTASKQDSGNNPLVEAMRAVGNPKISNDVGGDAEVKNPLVAAQQARKPHNK